MDFEMNWSEGSDVPPNLTPTRTNVSKTTPLPENDLMDVNDEIDHDETILDMEEPGLMEKLEQEIEDGKLCESMSSTFERKRVFGELFKAVRTRQPIARETAKKEALILGIEFVFMLSEELKRENLSSLSNYYRHRLHLGEMYLGNIIKHPMHFAIACILLACKHHGQMIKISYLIEKIDTDEAFRKTIFGTPFCYSTIGSSRIEVYPEVHALEAVLHQMYMRTRRALTLPEHYLRILLSVLCNAVPGTENLVEKRHDVVNCALLVLDEGYITPAVLHAPECALASLIIGCCLMRISLQKSLLNDMETAKDRKFGKEFPSSYLRLPLEEDVVLCCVEFLVDSQDHSISGNIRDAIHKYAVWALPN